MAGLREAVKGVSGRVEFAVVSLVAFGLFSYSSLLAVAAMFASSGAGLRIPRPTITESGLLGLLLYESVGMLVLGWCLGLRGWTRQRLGIVADLPKTAVGILLGVATYLIVLLVMNLFALSSAWLGTTLREGVAVSGGLRASTIVAISVVNPVFEETFVCAYLISVLKEKRGFWYAVNVSAAVRLVYHLYQGPVSILSVLPTGLVFGYWYARTGQLWPVIVAHALFDLTALYAAQ